MKLEKTKNYGLFIQNDEQRPIDERHAKRIAENVRAVGFLPSKPIQVYRKGGKLVVVDGHHRLAAAKSAGVEIFYVIEAASSQGTMAAENFLVKKWKVEDFVRMYAQRGNPAYVELLKYEQKGIPLTLAAAFLVGNSGSLSGSVLSRLSDGKFQIKTRDHANRIVEIINEFGGRNNTVSSRTFLTALSKCILCPVFDLDVLVKRIRENLNMLDKTSNVDQMLSQIEGIYNFRSRSPISLKFEVEKNQKARKENFFLKKTA